LVRRWVVTPDYEQAERYLRLLDPNAEQFTFQTFDDDEARKARRTGC
jgi:hypothetical protein